MRKQIYFPTLFYVIALIGLVFFSAESVKKHTNADLSEIIPLEHIHCRCAFGIKINTEN